MLYNTEQREILDAASAAINHARMLHVGTDNNVLAELRKATYQRKKDFTRIKELTESFDKKMRDNLNREKT